jgi:hypothetical protein
MKSAQTAFKTVDCAMCRGKCSSLETYDDETFETISDTLNYIENLEFLEMENNVIWSPDGNLELASSPFDDRIPIDNDEYYSYDELSHYEYESDQEDNTYW